MIKNEKTEDEFVLLVLKNLSIQFVPFHVPTEEMEKIFETDGLTLLKGTLLEIFLNLRNKN